MLARTVLPSENPVTLAEVKTYLKIPTNITDDDELIGDLISSAVEYVEDDLGISLATEQWQYTFRAAKSIILPRPPVQSVQSVTTMDNIDVPYTYIAETDTLEFDSSLGEILKVNYTAGYITLPKDLKIALMRVIAYMYENRTVSIPAEILGAVERYRVLKI